MNIGNMDVNVRATPHGVLAWTRDQARLYLLDRAKLTWSPIKYEAAAGTTLPAPMVDNCGLVYDPETRPHADRSQDVRREEPVQRGKYSPWTSRPINSTRSTPDGGGAGEVAV